MIDIRKLKELVRLMVENDLAELNLQDQQETVTVKRGYAGAPVVHHAPVMTSPAGHAPTLPAASSNDDDGAASAAASEVGLVAITSPMVGTFYASPNPDSPAFVTAGAVITDNTTVCLIEAMKVFNEIKAETSGTIERVLVQSGQAVEFGQKMYLIKPA